MKPFLTDDELRPAADFYGITIEEARARHTKVMDAGDNPFDPICLGCARRPYEIPDYVVLCMEGPNDAPTQEEVRRFVLEEEGTLNRENGHFLCDECYIRNGQPSSPGGWVCP